MFNSFVNTALRFGAEHDEFVVDSALIDQPLPTANVMMRRVFEHRAREALEALPAVDDFIPALLRELEKLDSNAVAVGAPRADEIRQVIPRDPRWFLSDEAELVLEDLICALTDCAGSAELYFGRRDPSSSEFGFWKSDD